MLSGVPQGTIFAPLLFLIFISHIDKDIFASKLISFTDDSRLYFVPILFINTPEEGML